MLSRKAFQKLEEAVGRENVSCEPAVLDTYAWQPTINDNPSKWVFRPAAVVLPASVEEVQETVRICNKHGLKFKAFSTGWGVYSGPTSENVVQIDMRRMNRIIEIDEKNMFAVIEPYVSGAQLQAEAMKLGLNTHIIGAGPACSPLASATSGWGMGWDSVYMSSSARNILGVEWVLPDGELLNMGAPGSVNEWFSGDGPGPSLRGIMRGASGTLGGLGVFTKCAVKLYNWPGPSQLVSEGLLLDSRIKNMPGNFKFYICFFPDKNSIAKAAYDLGDEELGYLFFKTASAAYLNSAIPALLKKIARTRNIRGILDRTLKWSFMVMLAGNSEGETSYMEEVFNTIIDKSGGFSIEMLKVPAVGSMLLMNFLRVSAVPMVFRTGGAFSNSLVRGETWDTQLNWAEDVAGIKKRWAEKDAICDNLGDNPFTAVYENNMWAQCENIIQYDNSREDHVGGLQDLLKELTDKAVNTTMEPLASKDSSQRKQISPLLFEFNRWQQKISAVFDTGRAADTGMYCCEDGDKD